MILAINYAMLILLIVFLGISFGVSKLLIKDKGHRVLVYIFLIGFTTYSGIGLTIYEIDEAFMYFLQYIAFIIIFIFFAVGSSNRRYKKMTLLSNNLTFIIENNPGLISCLTFIYILTFIFPFIYPIFNFLEIFNVNRLISGYKAMSFTIRADRLNNTFYQLITTQLRLIAMPFFYIYLYKNREKSLKFLILFVLPFYLQAINNCYLSRNEIAIIFVFVFAYLIKEKKLNRITAIVITCVAVPYLLYVFGTLFYLRVGAENSFDGFLPVLRDLFSKETNFVFNYSSASNVSDKVNVFQFLLYVITLPIPSGLMKHVGISTPILSQILTYEMIGLRYGDLHYYILLPSILGEGIIIFNKYFAWMYAFIFAPFAVWFLRILKANKALTYLMVWYLVDFARQMRGGSQFIISYWVNTIIPFAIIIFLLSSVKRNKVSVKYDNKQE